MPRCIQHAIIHRVSAGPMLTASPVAGGSLGRILWAKDRMVGSAVHRHRIWHIVEYTLAAIGALKYAGIHNRIEGWIHLKRNIQECRVNAMLHAIGGLPRPWMLAFHPWRSLPCMDGGNFHRTLHESRRDFYHQWHIPSIDGRDFHGWQDSTDGMRQLHITV